MLHRLENKCRFLLFFFSLSPPVALPPVCLLPLILRTPGTRLDKGLDLGKWRNDVGRLGSL